ncbi:hypothetical protein NDU88_002449 [Pleurodeles waltl]|uniref:Uncharacterized protein n=1 Tax=Pleurodeles waltl TaxID=8319 RepID=A0AAV7MB13_PLEWA|nr:hypothetical protein NDU88_002449 [Pleurodeles waltl]
MRETDGAFEALRAVSSSAPWPPCWFLGLGVPPSSSTSTPRCRILAALLKRLGQCQAPPPGLLVVPGTWSPSQQQHKRPAMRETSGAFEALTAVSSSDPWPPHWFLGLGVPPSSSTSAPPCGRPAALLKRLGQCQAQPPGLLVGSWDLESLPEAAQASPSLDFSNTVCT